jgi:phage terminase small subunit
MKFDIFEKMTDLQKRFVLAYCSDAFLFNATAAAKKAGYGANSPHAFEQIGYQNLRNPKIHAAITKVFNEVYATANLSIEKVLLDIEMTRVQSMRRGLYSVAAKCSELHGKYLKMFVDRVEHVRTVDDATEEELAQLLKNLVGKLDGDGADFLSGIGRIGGGEPAESGGADSSGTPTTH